MKKPKTTLRVSMLTIAMDPLEFVQREIEALVRSEIVRKLPMMPALSFPYPTVRFSPKVLKVKHWPSKSKPRLVVLLESPLNLEKYRPPPPPLQP